MSRRRSKAGSKEHVVCRDVGALTGTSLLNLRSVLFRAIGESLQSQHIPTAFKTRWRVLGSLHKLTQARESVPL
jgi:hypothetical protein